MIWVLRVGLPEETQPVLPGDELSPGARSCIWMQPLTWGQCSCPEAVGTIISQDNEQLQVDKRQRQVTGTQETESETVSQTLQPGSQVGPRPFMDALPPSSPLSPSLHSSPALSHYSRHLCPASGSAPWRPGNPRPGADLLGDEGHVAPRVHPCRPPLVPLALPVPAKDSSPHLHTACR